MSTRIRINTAGYSKCLKCGGDMTLSPPTERGGVLHSTLVCKCGHKRSVVLKATTRKGPFTWHCPECGATGNATDWDSIPSNCPKCHHMISSTTSAKRKGSAFSCPICGSVSVVRNRDRSFTCKACGAIWNIPREMRATKAAVRKDYTITCPKCGWTSDVQAGSASSVRSSRSCPMCDFKPLTVTATRIAARATQKGVGGCPKCGGDYTILNPSMPTVNRCKVCGYTWNPDNVKSAAKTRGKTDKAIGDTGAKCPKCGGSRTVEIGDPTTKGTFGQCLDCRNQ